MDPKAKCLELDPVSVTPPQTRLQPLWLRTLYVPCMWLHPPLGKLQTPEDQKGGWRKSRPGKKEAMVREIGERRRIWKRLQGESKWIERKQDAGSKFKAGGRLICRVSTGKASFQCPGGAKPQDGSGEPSPRSHTSW